jgi:hypothetical protein
VFLGACGIDPPPSGQFVSGWHLNQKYQQALIVPKYTNGNATNQMMDLVDAAKDLGTFLKFLGAAPENFFKGYSVGQALNLLNGDVSNGAVPPLDHSWQFTIPGGGNVNFFATPAH